MGQNLRAVEQIVANLENEQLVTPEQSEQFMRDYEDGAEAIREASQFLEKPELTKFLRYYIGCRYREKNRGKDKQNIRDKPHPVPSSQSRKQLSASMTELTKNQLKQKLTHHYKNSQQFLQKWLKQLCEVLVLQRWSGIGALLASMLREGLGCAELRVVRRREQGEGIGMGMEGYESEVDCYWEVGRESGEARRLEGVFLGLEKCIPMPKHNPSTNTLTFLLSWQKNSQILLDLTLPPQTPPQTHITILSDTSFQLTLSKILTEFINSFHNHTNNQNQSSQQNMTFIQKITSNILCGFEVMTLGAKIREEICKIDLARIYGGEYRVREEISALEYAQDNSHNSQLSLTPQFLPQLTKSHQKLHKTLHALTHYSSLLHQSCQFLDFNRYSELKFCFVAPGSPLLSKLQSCWRQKRTKIIDVMGENEGVMGMLREVGKGTGTGGDKGEAAGVVEGECQGYGGRDKEKMRVGIRIGEKNIFDGLTVNLGSYRSGRQRDKGVSFSKDIEPSKSKPKKDLTSMIQQRLVKDLQKSDPNIRTSGWLKLFVKETRTCHEVSSDKNEQKWSVTDIERMEGIEDPNLNILPLPDKQLLSWVWSIMKTNPFFNNMVTSETNSHKFQNFVLELQYNYTANGNKYHNFHHAVNVLHMCYLICSANRVHEYLSSMEIFGVLLSGLCHDVGHSGFGNKFQVESFGERALIYNDISPLENYQAAKTFKILKNTSNNFLHELQRPKFLQLKQNIIANILSTDFNRHSEILSKFQEWRKLPTKQQAKLQYSALAAMIIHTSDHAGSAKEHKIALEWRNLLDMEFARQHEMEKKLGLGGVSDSEYVSKGTQGWANTVCSYVKFIVLPLYREIGEFCGDWQPLGKILGNLNSGVVEWEKLAALEQDKDKDK